MRAISMSKPEYLPVVGSLYPRFGWSSLTPMTALPRASMAANVVEPGTVTLASTEVVTWGSPSSPDLPQAARLRTPARPRAMIIRMRMWCSSVVLVGQSAWAVGQSVAVGHLSGR